MENLSRKFKEIIGKTDYIFHIHTDYTDGMSSINDYFNYAFENNINTIIFTEHVRKLLKYDFNKFIKEVKEENKVFPGIQTFIGCEAKLLIGGEIDIPINILPEIDIICFACHSFPEDLELYKLSFKNLFTDKRWKDFIRVWVHPGRFLKKFNIIDQNMDVLQDIISVALSEGVFIEKNLKENLPPIEMLEKISSDKIITGYDAHSVNELKFFMKRNNNYEYSSY